MSFAEKVSALHDLFGVPTNAPLPIQLTMMREQMGIAGAGTLRPCIRDRYSSPRCAQLDHSRQ